MSHEDSGWRPKGAMEEFDGYEVWDHGIGAHQVNAGEVDGEIEFDFVDDAEPLDDGD
ncbi:MAG: hypothetical protein ABEJ61_08520 [Haloferacaceae archaeon]